MYLEVPNGILNQMPAEREGGRLGSLRDLCARAHNGLPAIDVRMNADINPTCCLIQLPREATDATVDSLCQLIMENRVK